MAKGILGQLVDLAKAVASAARSTPPPPESTERPARPAERPSGRSRLRRDPSAPRPAAPAPGASPHAAPAPGPERVRYAPQADGQPDPGEVVWAWVPYEEDSSRGKDRPVLVLDVDSAGAVTGLMLTSKDHAGPRSQGERDHDGRRWLDVGTGAWDSQRRPSEVRLDRLLHLPAGSVRREGAALPRDVFERVVAASRRQSS